MRWLCKRARLKIYMEFKAIARVSNLSLKTKNTTVTWQLLWMTVWFRQRPTPSLNSPMRGGKCFNPDHSTEERSWSLNNFNQENTICVWTLMPTETANGILEVTNLGYSPRRDCSILKKLKLGRIGTWKYTGLPPRFLMDYYQTDLRLAHRETTSLIHSKNPYLGSKISILRSHYQF